MTSKVKLVSITNPLIEIDVVQPEFSKWQWLDKILRILYSCPKKPSKRTLTPEEYVTYIARVSNPKNQTNLATAEKLLNYCIKKSHWSIFEQVDMTLEIETSLSIGEQLLRHRSAVFQKYSGRYAELQSIEPIEFRFQDTKNRQNSFGTAGILSMDGIKDTNPQDSELRDLLEDVQEYLKEGLELYKELLEHGIAKESARMILVGATTTRFYMKNNLRNWIHYIQVRALGEGVQKEHREIALAIQDIFKEQFPVISKALDW